MDNLTKIDHTGHRLIQLGIILFFAGLATGFIIPLMENPRVGLASHLEGILNGLLLMVLGILWPRLKLDGWKNTVAATLALFGTFANWLATLLAGLWGTGAMMPVAAPDRAGTAIQEAVVTGLLMSLSLAMVATCAIVFWSLRDFRAQTR